MSIEQRDSESRGWSASASWVLVLVAVPVCYLLSVPWVWSYHTKRKMMPDWVMTYSFPYAWARAHTPLTGPLDVYEEWCDAQMD